MHFMVRQFFGKRHKQFQEHVFQVSHLYPGQFCSIIPTVLFMVSTFGLLYMHFHPARDRSAKWQSRILKEVVFQWAYFYATRIWYIFLKLVKLAVRYSDSAMEASVRGTELYYNQIVTHSCIFLLVLSVSLVPCVLLYKKNLERMREIPNFLMWLVEDPWVRSEIGTAGHYLMRPPVARVYNPYRDNANFRSGRSSSADSVEDKPSGVRLRPVRSAESIGRGGD